MKLTQISIKFSSIVKLGIVQKSEYNLKTEIVVNK